VAGKAAPAEPYGLYSPLEATADELAYPFGKARPVRVAQATPSANSPDGTPPGVGGPAPPVVDPADRFNYLDLATVETAPEGYRQILDALGKARQDEVESAGKAEAKKAKAKAEYAEAEKQAVEPIFRQREQAMKGVRLPETFAPTETNSQDLMLLFTLTGIAGILLGRGGGKQAALGAQQAMTGMMQGYMAGRKDLYDRERQNFETNIKLMDARKREISDAFEVAFKEATTIGLSQAKTNLENKLAAAGADILLAKVRTESIEAGFQVYKELLKVDGEREKLEARLKEAEIKATAQVKAAQFRAAASRQSAILAGRAENIKEAFAQSAADLVNLALLSAKHPNTVMSAFAGMTGKSGDDLLTSLRNTFARQVTPFEQRAIQQLISGIEGHLAFALGGGYASAMSKPRMDQYRDQIAKAGDKPQTHMLMMARLRQELNILADNYASKPGATSEMNAKVQEWNSNINAAIPYTVVDVVEAGLPKGVPPPLPPGIPPGSIRIGKTPGGQDVYRAPDGKNYTPE